MAATPFVLCEPTIARFAMRIFRSGPSSTRLTRSRRPSSPGKRARTSSRRRRLISRMISEVTRDEDREPRERPLLERLRKQRVVGIRQRPPREVPRLVPGKVCLVEQDAHQLRHGHGGMRVVQLDGDAVGQIAPVGVAPPEASRTRSASEHATRKYSCTKRNPGPGVVESSG